MFPQAVSVTLRDDFPIRAKRTSPRLGGTLAIPPLMLYPSLADVGDPMTGQNYPIAPLTDNDCQPTMNPLTNYIDCQISQVNPHFQDSRLEEPFFLAGWSRDSSRESPQVAGGGIVDIYATTVSSDRGNTFANLGDAVLSFLDDETYSGETSSSENWLFAESDNRQANFEPNFPENTDFYATDGQYYLDSQFGAQAPQPQNALVAETTTDDLPIESSQSIISNTMPESYFHYQSKTQGENVCNECSLHFPNNSALNNHAKQTQHTPYACICGVTFSRMDTLNRHLEKYSPNVSYPCPHCSKFSGQRAFPRRDHLTQHLRGYHNIELSSDSPGPQSSSSRKTALSCPHEDCSYHHDAASSSTSPSPKRYFPNKKDFTKHLREVHDESLYPCDAPGCSKVGGRGFFRKRDLLKHQKNHYEDSDSTLQFS